MLDERISQLDPFQSHHVSILFDGVENLIFCYICFVSSCLSINKQYPYKNIQLQLIGTLL